MRIFFAIANRPLISVMYSVRIAFAATNTHQLDGIVGVSRRGAGLPLSPKYAYVL